LLCFFVAFATNIIYAQPAEKKSESTDYVCTWIDCTQEMATGEITQIVLRNNSGMQTIASGMLFGSATHIWFEYHAFWNINYNLDDVNRSEGWVGHVMLFVEGKLFSSGHTIIRYTIDENGDYIPRVRDTFLNCK
jgi:hypothetical protein